MIRSGGKVRSLKEQKFLAQANGEIQISHALTGSRYNTGTLLLQMETSLIEIRLNKALQALFNGQKEYESLLLGYESLLKDKDSLQAADIRKKLRISTGVMTAEQDEKEARYELARSSIKAPFNGILADVRVRQGQLVRAGDELFSIYDPDDLVVEIKVLESDVGLLQQNMNAAVSPVSYPGRTYNAEVYEINPYVDANGMVEIKLKIRQPASNGQRTALFPGMNCTTLIKIPQGQTLVVPREAIVMRGGRAVVFTIDKGLAKWNYVSTGKDNGAEIEVKQGLEPGARVIISNNLQLSHDAPVQEIN